MKIQHNVILFAKAVLKPQLNAPRVIRIIEIYLHVILVEVITLTLLTMLMLALVDHYVLPVPVNRITVQNVNFQTEIYLGVPHPEVSMSIQKEILQLVVVCAKPVLEPQITV